MKTQSILLPYVLIAFGMLYLLKPDIFHNLLTMRRPLDQRVMPKANQIFMRGLGTLFVLVGLAMLFFGNHPSL